MFHLIIVENISISFTNKCILSYFESTWSFKSYIMSAELFNKLSWKPQKYCMPKLEHVALYGFNFVVFSKITKHVCKINVLKIYFKILPKNTKNYSMYIFHFLGINHAIKATCCILECYVKILKISSFAETHSFQIYSSKRVDLVGKWS